MIATKLEVIATSACKTIYRVNGVEVILSIITGGTPTICYEFYHFSERFPIVERWSNKHWKVEPRNMGRTERGKYDHQDFDNLIGPTAEEVLPNGEQTMIDFVEKHRPLYELRMKRFNELLDVIGNREEVESKKRFHDKDNQTYFRATFRLHHVSTPCVTLHAGCYSGKTGDALKKYGDRAWNRLAEVADKYPKTITEPNVTWEELTEEQFKELKEAIKAVA